MKVNCMGEIKRSNKELIARARETIEREANGVRSLIEQMSEALRDLVHLLINCAGRTLVTGTGTSRFVAERFAHLLCCCGAPALFINAADGLHGGAGAVTSDDVVFAISKGGRSAEINQFVKIAKSRGAKIAALTENPVSPLGELSDVIYSIAAEGDIDPFGMIAAGSSLANCAACDVLCVLLLEEKGFSREQFGETHPGGAVGMLFENDAP